MESTVFAICEVVHGIDGRGGPDFIIKKIFDYRFDAEDAVFPPYVVEEIEIDTVEELAALERKLTVKQKHALKMYNKSEIMEYLKL